MLSRKADGPLSVHIPRPGGRSALLDARRRHRRHRLPRRRRVAAARGRSPRTERCRRRLGHRVGGRSAGAAAAPAQRRPARAPAATAERPRRGRRPGARARRAGFRLGDRRVTASSSLARPSDGDSLKGGDCGTLPGLDSIVMPRLRKLAECPDAAGATGKLHLVVHIDFPRGGIGVDLGKGNGVSASDALLACAKTDMSGAAPAGIAHENPRYSVAYSVTFGSGTPGNAPSSGTSTPPAHPGGDRPRRAPRRSSGRSPSFATRPRPARSSRAFSEGRSYASARRRTAGTP